MLAPLLIMAMGSLPGCAAEDDRVALSPAAGDGRANAQMSAQLAHLRLRAAHELLERVRVSVLRSQREFGQAIHLTIVTCSGTQWRARATSMTWMVSKAGTRNRWTAASYES